MVTTVSVLKARAGGYVGDGHVHPALLDAARESVAEAKASGTVSDGYVTRCGPAVTLVLLHGRGPGAGDIVHFALDTFSRTAAVGGRLGQHAAHPELDGDRSVEVAEVSFEPRRSEAVACMLSSRAGSGAFNAPLYRIFADPFVSPSVARPHAGEGYAFTVCSDGGSRRLSGPRDIEALLGLLRPGTDPIRAVLLNGEQIAASSAGPDPVMVVRCEDPYPAVGEALEAFAQPTAVAADDDPGSVSPLMPVSTNDDATSRVHGPPRVIGIGFQVAEGRLVGPRDLLGDKSFDGVRAEALQVASYLQRALPRIRGVRPRVVARDGA